MIEHGNLTAGSTVYEDAVEDIHLHDLVAHVLRIGGESCTQDLLIIVEINAITVEYEIVHIANADYVQFQTS